MNSLAQLTDDTLHGETKRLAGNSNALTAQLLAHLGEVEARGIHRERACSSLYTYCVYELRMSEDEAQRRCRAARLARQFPVLLEMLAEASLHLTGILLLGPHLTDENCTELLARARFRTKREIERLVAEIAPWPDVPSRIVPLRAGAAEWALSLLDDESPGLLALPRNTWAAYVQGLAGEVRELQAGLGAGQAPPRPSDPGEPSPSLAEPAAAASWQNSNALTSWQASNDATSWQGVTAAAHDSDTGGRTPASDDKRGVSTPVPCGAARPTAPLPTAELRYKVQFTADQAYVNLLEEACNLLQHELPARDLLAVQCRALELLVHKLRQRKYAACERPRRKASEPAKGAPPAQPAPTPARPRAVQPATNARHSAPSATRPRRATPKSANSGRYIPAEVRRRVWQRDEARCAYVDARGQRCREQSGLQFHHEHPHARGGPPTMDNLALRCGPHNTLAAEQDFGRDIIRAKRARKESVTAPLRAGTAGSAWSRCAHSDERSEHAKGV